MKRIPIDLDKPATTREGLSARCICSDRIVTNTQMPFVWMVTTKSGIFEYVVYTNEYGLTHRDGSESRDDIINVPVKRKGWVNYYEASNGIWCSDVYTTKELAAKESPRGSSALSTLLATMPIEFEEGEGLD